jgi:chromosome segregation ATPase
MGETSENGKSSKNPIWWGLAIAIVAIAGAASYRLARGQGAFEFQGNSEGFKLISEAQASVSSATNELNELRKQIEAKDASLKQVATDLAAREAEIQRLLLQLEQAGRNAPPSPDVQSLNVRIARLKATDARSAAPVPKIDWSKYESATRSLDSAHSALSKVSPKK